MRLRELLSESELLALVERYNVQGPRYTSYPTVPVWKELSPDDFREGLQRAGGKERLVSVYLHLPYCNSRCLFCGCNAWVTRSDAVMEQYVKALEREIETVAALLPEGVRCSQLHLGGGTPSDLPPRLLAGLLDTLEAAIPALEGSERSLEVFPGQKALSHLKNLTARGFNRISLGVQDFDEGVQRAVARVNDYDTVRATVDGAREAGFASVNIDLIYGLPFQTPKSWRASVARVVSLRPDRLAVFGYAHMPDAKAHQRALSGEQLPGGAQRLSMMLDAQELLQDAGYSAIGFDHFALPGDPLALARKNRTLYRNFQGYTVRKGDELVGLGCSGISELSALFAQNLVQPGQYRERVCEGGLATFRGLHLTEDDLLRKETITHLMCNLEVGPPSVPRERLSGLFAKELERLEEFVKAGLLERGGRMRVTPVGQLFLRNIAMVFDPYYNPSESGRYSRTV